MASTDDKRTIDVRVFILSIISCMVISFGAGIIYGPTPDYGAASKETTAAMKPLMPDDKVRDVESVTHRLELGKLKNKHNLEEHHVNYDEPSLEYISNDRAKLENATGNPPDKDEDEEHLPAGQHLLVDMSHLEAAFLNSESRLAQATIDVIKDSELTLLSYHCHSLEPAGVSCVGVLLESHISFHTWPDEGVITLDLFTCGAKPLVPVVPVIERLFGIPRVNATSETGELEEVVTMWSHELRGFRHHEARRQHVLDLHSDLAWYATSPLDSIYKKEIASIVTPFQRIDIWDIKDHLDYPTYEDILKHKLEPGDPRYLSTEISTPTRYFFLGGALQAMSDTFREFSEALVQPAMFAHPEPRRVAIIGGGDGSSLREVLKHNTVDEVKMIEIDSMVVDAAREHMPQMSDCSDFEGSAASCFEDPRAEIIFDDASKFFLNNYSAGKSSKHGLFDVIITDALDPENKSSDLSTEIYTSFDFVTALMASLTPDGVLAFQIGTAPNIHDPKASKGVYAAREKLFNLLEDHPDTTAMLVYEEAHCGFEEPRGFMVVCKSENCRHQWYADSDAIDFEVYQRIRHTKSGENALSHYDGATQYTFSVTPKAWETVYCRREPMPEECHYRGLDMDTEIHEFDTDSEESSFYIKKDETTGEALGIFAATYIEEGSYIMPHDMASSFTISKESKDNLQENAEVMEEIDEETSEAFYDFLAFVEENGHATLSEGHKLSIVEVGPSSLIRAVDSADEANIGSIMPRPEGFKLPTYSPVYERRRGLLDVFLVATKDISEGEEILRPKAIWG